MPELMSEDDLRQTAMHLLESKLGPVETLRFLSLIRREPFDYEAWRQNKFDGLTVEELFRKMRELEASP
jgi:hypothetical protein